MSNWNLINLAHSIMRVPDVAKHRQLLIKAASDVGARRASVLSVIDSIDAAEPLFTVEFDTARATISRNGLVLKDDINDDDKLEVMARGFVHSALRGIPGAAHANKRIGKDLIIPSGVCLILGAGGTGKTPLAHALASHGVQDYSVVRIGEPLAGYASDPALAAAALAGGIFKSANVVLDSIKDLLSSAEGAAMKSGISRGAISGLSSWSSVACELGATVFVPVNASTDDPEVMKMLSEAARSNATMAILHQPDGSWQYFARQGEGLPRNSGRLSFSYADDGTGLVNVTAGTKPVQESVFESLVHASISAWSQAQRRALAPRQ